MRGTRWDYENGYAYANRHGRYQPEDALIDVALLLGYASSFDYNAACEDHPREVWRRLREA